MARQLWIADAARNAGLKVQEVPGWQTRGSADFSPRGVILHHTAGPAKGNMPSLGIVTNGRADLPGPLSQFGLGRDGTVYVIAAGRANHAGAGTWRGASGNAQFFGIEAENNGVGEAWPAAQLDAYVRLATALCRHMGVTADMVAGHKEYATPRGRKPDPRGIDCDWFRNAVRAGLSGTAARTKEKDEMTPEQEAKLDEAVRLANVAAERAYLAADRGEHILTKLDALSVDGGVMEIDGVKFKLTRVEE